MEPVQEFAQPLEGSRAFDLLAPRLDDGRADDLHDVNRVGELGAEGVAFPRVHRMLKERAENFGLNFVPIKFCRIAQKHQFAILDFQLSGIGKKTAVEVRDFLVTSATRRFGLVHGLEKSAQQFVAVRRCRAFFEQVGDEILWQQINVLGE